MVSSPSDEFGKGKADKMETINLALLGHQRTVSPEVLSTKDASTPLEEAVLQFAGYHLKVAASWLEKKAAHQLRATIYDTELQWSHANNGMEADVFDQYAIHYVVVAPCGEVVATLRVLEWEAPWMATECFDGRFSGEAALFQTPLTQEVSRLCIAQSHRDKKIAGRYTVLDLVLKGLLAVGRLTGKRYSYFVTRAAMERALMRRGFVVPYASSVHKMPDGCRIKSFFVDNFKSDQCFTVCDSGPCSNVRHSFEVLS